MNSKTITHVITIALLYETASALAQSALSPMTYQGHLKRDGAVVDGFCDFQFAFYGQMEGGNLIGELISLDDQDVANGLFTATMDVDPSLFNEEPRWLEVRVKCDDDLNFMALTPRHEITSVPRAMHTRGIAVDGQANVGIGTTTPDAKLDLVFNSPTDSHKAVEFEFTGAGGSEIDFLRNSTVNGQSPRLFRIQGGNDFDFFPSFGLGMVTNHPLRIFTNDVERMRISSGGNVGIGTTDPLYPLDVNGMARVTSIRIPGGNPQVGRFLTATNTQGAATWADLPPLGPNVVGSANIIDGSVGNLDLGDNSVTANKIADSSVTANKIASNAVGTSELAPASVSVDKMSGAGAFAGQVPTYNGNAVVWSAASPSGIQRLKISATDAGASGPDVIVQGAGQAQVTRNGNTITINVPQVLCTYANHTYSTGAQCRETPANTCFPPFPILTCQADGSWSVATGTNCNQGVQTPCGQ